MKWFYKRKIEKLAKQAELYAKIWCEAPPQPRIQNSFSAPKPQKEDEKKIAQPQKSEKKSEQSSVRYSLGSDFLREEPPLDRYDSESIERVLRNLYSEKTPQNAKRSLEQSVDMGFADKMMALIDAKQRRVVDVYKAAQIDRRLFSKIISDRSYSPSKDTCVALALALELSAEEANDLLSRAGYVLSHSCKRDVVLEFFFKEGIYNLDDVNAVLYHLFARTLGRKTSY